jgi:hypothetical protein
MPIGSVALILGAPHPAMVFFLVVNLCLGPPNASTWFPVLVPRLNTEPLLMILLKLVGFGIRMLLKEIHCPIRRSVHVYCDNISVATQ